MESKPVNLAAFDREQMAAYFAEIGDKPFRANQVFKWIYQEGCTDFDSMTNLSKTLRQKLAETTVVKFPEVEVVQESTDGTLKWLMRLEDGNGIEVVFIPEDDRGTLCISSQVGCGLNCTFCATARQGFNRNLESSEIVGQVWQAWQRLNNTETKARPITNIVLMGMGEPLLNFDRVVSAIRTLRDDFGFGLSKRRITLSTAGMVPEILKLAEQERVSLAISLHAAEDTLRTRLIPLNKKYNIKTLLDACRQYVRPNTRDKITYEYLLLDGINDSDEQAHALGHLLKDMPAKVNLIPFNPIKGIDYKRSTRKRVDAFRDILITHGLVTMTRKTRGDDIDAACGQLVGSVDDKTKRSIRLNALTIK